MKSNTKHETFLLLEWFDVKRVRQITCIVFFSTFLAAHPRDYVVDVVVPVLAV